jgi:hypothetical protein
LMRPSVRSSSRPQCARCCLLPCPASGQFTSSMSRTPSYTRFSQILSTARSPLGLRTLLTQASSVV